MKNHKIRNKAIGQGSCVNAQHDPKRDSEPYSYSRKNNTDTRLICRTCMHREVLDGNSHCCMCMGNSGVPRDQHATSSKCATYKRGAAKKKVLF